MPEITDQELLAAQRALELIKNLAQNPEARGPFERALKVLDPRVETSEEAAARAAAPFVQRIETLEKTLNERAEADAKEREERSTMEAMNRLNDGFAKLRSAGLTDEGEEAVKKLMKERTIPDPEAAFALYQRQNPPARAEESAWTPPQWNYEEDLMPDAKDWFQNPDKAESQAIGQVLLEMRRTRDE